MIDLTTLTDHRVMVTASCGCCGRDVFDAEWCADCSRHVLRGVCRPPWEQTWLAQHGTDCPWQVYA